MFFVRRFPNSTWGMQVIERSQEIESLALAFCRAGGRYFCEVQEDGHVLLEAQIESSFSPGSLVGVREDQARNDHTLSQVIDELVRRSSQYTSRVVN